MTRSLKNVLILIGAGLVLMIIPLSTLTARAQPRDETSDHWRSSVDDSETDENDSAVDIRPTDSERENGELADSQRKDSDLDDGEWEDDEHWDDEDGRWEDEEEEWDDDEDEDARWEDEEEFEEDGDERDLQAQLERSQKIVSVASDKATAVAFTVDVLAEMMEPDDAIRVLQAALEKTHDDVAKTYHSCVSGVAVCPNGPNIGRATTTRRNYASKA